MQWNGGISIVALALVVLALPACDATDVVAPTGDVAAFGSGADDGRAGTTAQVRVRCELRRSRSKISVDGNNLSPAGAAFSARVRSGAKTAAAPARAAVGDEVEFDFDSNRNDIAAGATAIPANFIQIVSGPDVVGEILDASGTVVATGSADCRTR